MIDSALNPAPSGTFTIAALRVRWKNRENLAELQGRLVRLCVCMRQAHWYAFEFGYIDQPFQGGLSQASASA